MPGVVAPGIPSDPSCWLELIAARLEWRKFQVASSQLILDEVFGHE